MLRFPGQFGLKLCKSSQINVLKNLHSPLKIGLSPSYLQLAYPQRQFSTQRCQQQSQQLFLNKMPQTLRSTINTFELYRKQFSFENIRKYSKGFGDGFSDKYNRLNRFQNFQKNNPWKNNSLKRMTITGLGLMVGIYFLSPYLFDYVPPFKQLRQRPTELVYALIGINCAVFGLWRIPRCWNFLQRYMLLQKVNGSKWAIVGSAFSHQELWHLGFNMLALWSFGTSLATMLGATNFFSLYMNSAIAGSLFSLWYPKMARIALMGSSLGASGALFGVFGCFSYIFPTAKILLFIFPIPGGAWMGFLATMVWNAAGCAFRWRSFDYAAHLGGSLIGIAYGWSISKTFRRRKQERLQRVSKWY